MRAVNALHRLGAAVLLVVTLLTLMPPARAGAVAPLYSPQTGHTVGPHFTLAWRERGGVAILGYPLSEEFEEGGRTTQYFERAVLQTFPEYVGTPYYVQGIQLGRELISGREAEAPSPSPPPTAPSSRRPGTPSAGRSVIIGWREAA